jgi:hypothetical protein
MRGSTQVRLLAKQNPSRKQESTGGTKLGWRGPSMKCLKSAHLREAMISKLERLQTVRAKDKIKAMLWTLYSSKNTRGSSTPSYFLADLAGLRV